MNFLEYSDRDMLAIDVANQIAGDLKGALLHHETVSLAVPGGTTPGAIFDNLCAALLDWNRVHVLPTDERCVPVTDERSNGRMIMDRLFVGKAAEATFLPLYDPFDEQPEAPAVILERELPLSVLLLGMGADMHTASLFPGMDNLQAALSANAPVLVLAQPNSQPEDRISMSAPVLNGALSKHLVVFGTEKRDAFEHALTLPPEEAPITSVLDSMTVHWAE
ncbi:6-phosphogluconolactonase [Phaeobacter sp. NW0010-22]|uniref:6-phosphogluconolactonase n=1 Tax=Phaeobacter sp. NW0010-22 TaxID=3135907 RepID=UPI003106C119